jgi:ribulose-phosphate 3-epimerase
MDNHYVPNLTFGPMVCEALRPFSGAAMMDVHLMVEPVDALVPAFAKAGAGLISFHPEASRHVDRTLAMIREQGCKTGLVFNRATPRQWLHKPTACWVQSRNPALLERTPTTLV